MEKEMKSFLEECSQSGDIAYNAFKRILQGLENPHTRSSVRVFLHNLQNAISSQHNCLAKYHFNIHDISLYNFDGSRQVRNKLTMMELPSIFIDEDWSSTFFEGINRHPGSMFRDKTVAELGCGNGRISIALANKWSPFKVYGLDINPRAVKVAWINLYLNSFDETGSPICDHEGKTLLEKVEFHESDLLSYCREHNIILDCIIACIPQVLNPNPEAIIKLVTEGASEEFLFSLSNYRALQGFVEGQSGLGLIARAVEEGIFSIKPLGKMIFNMGGRPGHDVGERLFEFHESDLLSYCREHNIILDRIIARIPQDLNPNPEAMSKLVTEGASEIFLFSLSNYRALQGFVEDQFGLGLINRAVEEGISSIKPSGKMIFNMGGHLGHHVCERLFERRGFCISKLWQTRVLQAADTDISALVEIEKNSRHRFEFFMGLVSDEPICASTAWAYAKSGGQISHALSVYSCQMRQPNNVKAIFDFLKTGFEDASSAMDLSFTDEAVADEKLPFLAHLARFLKEHLYFPYEPPEGSTRFRELIARFLCIYHHVPVNSDNIVVFPTRAVAIENALHLFSPTLALVDEHLTKNLPKKWLTSSEIESQTTAESSDSVTVIEVPNQSDLMVDLIKKLKPQMVVTGLADFEAKTSAAFEQLLDETRRIGSRLFLNMSDQLELFSLPASNGILKYLETKRLPSHAAVLCALVKNKVYSDLEVAFVISESKDVYSALARTTELLQSRTAFFSQCYYGCLLNELLTFQLPNRYQAVERLCSEEGSANMISVAESAVKVLSKAELSNSERKNGNLVHMDLDQSALPIPSALKGAVFESFARQNILDTETELGRGIKDLMKTNYGLSQAHFSDIFLGDSPLALFTKLVLVCIQEGGTLCFPVGCNGNYVYAAEFLNAKIARIQTSIDTMFKLTDKLVEQFLETVDHPWIYISGPTINPTGLIYTNDEICSILLVCKKYGARVILDTSFSGLEFLPKSSSMTWNFESSSLTSPHPSYSLSILGGASFGMLTAGLEFGYLALTQTDLAEAFKEFPSLSHPHGTTKYTIKKLLALYMQKSSSLLEALSIQKHALEIRFGKIKEVLENCGWKVLDSSSGISMVARPIAYEGKSVSLKDSNGNALEQIILNGDNIREAMMRTTGLCINSSLWTGIPGYCRFAIAIEDEQFQKSLQLLDKFKEHVLGK